MIWSLLTGRHLLKQLLEEMTDRDGLVVRSLVKHYGKKTAVDELSFSVEKGGIFALLGPNGAGKTTTLKMISGLIIPDSGSVVLNGRPASEVRQKVAYVPDEPTIFPNLSGREYLRYTGRLRGLSRSVIDRRTLLCSRLFEMDGWLDSRSGSYSHGMIQRVILSSAFVAKPDLYVIDEPLVGLDPPAAETFWRMVEGAATQGAVVIISTHTLSIASIHCRRFGIIHHGKLLHTVTHGELSGGDLQQLFFKITGTSPAEVHDYFQRDAALPE
ncbi:ABC transporter ATP-binding protein [Candidatus Fermentibacteria bacterium]|nr:MAG: ABC transporter ATP-binding protein [Candidatus Fermentibacteria bacterium]